MLFKLATLIVLAGWVDTFGGVNAQSDACLRLQGCLVKVASDAGVPTESLTGWDASTCDTLVSAYGGEGIAAVCAAAETLPQGGRKLAASKDNVSGLRGASEPVYPTAITDEVLSQGRNLQLSCAAPFTPAYGDDEPSGGYDDYVASIIGTFIKDGKRERTSANDVGAYMIGFGAAKVALGAVTGVPVAETVAAVAAVAFDIVVDQIEFQDGDIDAAEIEATFENTKSLLTQVCSLGNQVLEFEEFTNTQLVALSSALIDLKTFATSRFTTVDTSITNLSTSTTTRFNTVDTNIANFRVEAQAASDGVAADIEAFRAEAETRFDTLDTTLVELKTYVTERFDTVEATLISRFDQLDRASNIIRTLLITPEGRKTAFNKQGLICDGVETIDGNCPTVPNFPAP